MLTSQCTGGLLCPPVQLPPLCHHALAPMSSLRYAETMQRSLMSQRQNGPEQTHLDPPFQAAHERTAQDHEQLPRPSSANHAKLGPLSEADTAKCSQIQPLFHIAPLLRPATPRTNTPAHRAAKAQKMSANALDLGAGPLTAPTSERTRPNLVTLTTAPWDGARTETDRE